MLPTSQNCNGDILFIKISPKITLAETYLRISLEQPLETHGEVKSFEKKNSNTPGAPNVQHLNSPIKCYTLPWKNRDEIFDKK